MKLCLGAILVALVAKNEETWWTTKLDFKLYVSMQLKSARFADRNEAHVISESNYDINFFHSCIPSWLQRAFNFKILNMFSYNFSCHSYRKHRNKVD